MIGDDLDVFFGTFGVPVEANGLTGTGIIDMPTLAIGDGMVLSDEYLLTCKASEFGSLSCNATVYVDDGEYRVREVRKIDDGKLCEISLSKV